MKRFLVLSACIVLCSSLVARAELMNVLTVGDPANNFGLAAGTSLGTIDAVRTIGISSGVDRLLLNIGPLLSLAAGGTGPNPEGITIVEGNWTASAPGGLRVTTGAISYDGGMGSPDWGAETRRGPSAGRDAYTSFVNLDSKIGTLNMVDGKYYKAGVVMFDRTGTWTSAGWTGVASNNLRGSWFTEGTPLSMNAGTGLTYLGAMFVPTGGSVSYLGKIGYTAGGGRVFNVTIGEVPEPSTLVLLGMGLMGLVCYAWRKRK